MRVLNEEVIDAWFYHVTTQRKPERRCKSNGKIHFNGKNLYSTKSKFILATVLPFKRFNRVLLLLNGDIHNVETTRQQETLRNTTHGWQTDRLIVPFAALKAAGIDRNTIRPIEIRRDEFETIRRTSKIPPRAAPNSHVNRNAGRSFYGTDWGWVRRENERWVWTESRHRLGDSVFTAEARGRRRTFLSSFDYQELTPLYFLCELPRKRILSVTEAYEFLKPKSVLEAEKADMTVSRQGDMFAIETELSTKDVLALTPHRKGRVVKKPKRGLLGTNHTATEVVFATYGRVYAKGCLYHNPEGRGPDHKRQRMGNGRSWHLLTRNTVPVSKKPITREVV